MRVSGRGGLSPESGKPSRHGAAVSLVFCPKGLPQVRLFVKGDEKVGTHRHDDRHPQDGARGVPEHMPDQENDHAHVDGVADDAIQPTDHQFLRRVGGGGGAPAADGECPGAPEHPCRADGPERDRQPAEDAKGEERRVGLE